MKSYLISPIDINKKLKKYAPMILILLKKKGCTKWKMGMDDSYMRMFMGIG